MWDLSPSFELVCRESPSVNHNPVPSKGDRESSTWIDGPVFSLIWVPGPQSWDTGHVTALANCAFSSAGWSAQLSSGDGLGQHTWGYLPAGLVSWPKWHTPHLLPPTQIPAPLRSFMWADCTWRIRPTHLIFVKERKRVWLCECVPGHSQTAR